RAPSPAAVVPSSERKREKIPVRCSMSATSRVGESRSASSAVVTARPGLRQLVPTMRTGISPTLLAFPAHVRFQPWERDVGAREVPVQRGDPKAVGATRQVARLRPLGVEVLVEVEASAHQILLEAQGIETRDPWFL